MFLEIESFTGTRSAHDWQYCMERESKQYIKALLRLGSECNNACIFCHSRPMGGGVTKLNAPECRRRIRVLARLGVDMVVFSGGEPTIREDIADLCAYAKRQGMASGVITNGRMFAYRDFGARLFDAGLRYALVSLHGGHARIHNHLTAAPSFEQTVKGLANIARLPLQLTVNTVLTRVNAGTMAQIIQIIGKFPPVHYKISLPEPKGAAINCFDVIASPDEASAIARDILAAPVPKGVTLGFDGFTPCMLGGRLEPLDDFFTHGFRVIWEHNETNWFPPDNGDRIFTPVCPMCSLKHLCPGIYREYMARFPEFRPEPVVRRVSNAVRYEKAGTAAYEPKEGGGCAPELRTLVPERTIAVKNGNKLNIFNSNELETNYRELMYLKYEVEQVYHCGAVSTRNLDYAKQLKKLNLMQRCRSCERRFFCPGIYLPARNHPFEAAVHETRTLMESLKGQVCEIGCGRSPAHFEYIKRKINEGGITRYVGVDPAAAADASEMRGKFVLKRVFLEDFVWTGKPFDTVAMFRSLHHLHNLPAALNILDAVTTSGTNLIITEDIKHIELHATAAANGKYDGAELHHFRNASLSDAVQLFQTIGFRETAASHIGRHTAGFWTLVCVKT